MKKIQSDLRSEPGTRWYRLRIVGPVTSESNEIRGNLASRYDIRDAYDHSHLKKDPYLAPHGFFQRLKYQQPSHAREFLEKFGPLTLPVATRVYGEGAAVIVDLGEFWCFQRRFSLVLKMWEGIGNREQLAIALLNLYRNRKQLSEYDKFPLATQFSPPPSNRRSPFKFPWQTQSRVPWKVRRQSAETWLTNASVDEMNRCAVTLAHLELNAHMLYRQVLWQRGWEESGRKFRPIVWVDSLWSAIWEFWGWDTANVSWRRCPHCQQLFYPKRRDQCYCTPRQQALASKRDYVRRLRAGELGQKRTES